ncbi:MAG: cytidine deaminase [Candidatus Eremiobacteraeota bacterium]|nr:cytidine deaminase [Candidatus Eremiobacteraeota bacterium]
MHAAAAELLAAARRARDHAYAPYSGYKVGAAVLTGAGEIVAGANVENAAFPLSICAERSAVAAAVAGGARTFEAIAIVADDGAATTPCGGCRQVLLEFGPELVVIRENRPETSLRELLPDPFDATHLRDRPRL